MSIIENLEAMRARGQDSALLRYSLGNEYLKQEHTDQAIEHLAEATRQDPNYSAAWKLYGKVLTQASRHAEALEVLHRGIEVAEAKGDAQAAKEMRVFLKRAQKAHDGHG
ncbi:MAG: tetratricopeptide repeat protein [Lamprobacter sp.]|uniref:tetratricopeptide repeat protein n=1 Tax=Lamprobacter sp. TaxID=3100796 RepID=UPI002B25B675|nr:tetratricopeptide repeat protein [Lamprobacter sp.]MEA3640954.1 tetratricopeptide repeat protein [Lamprobacter sp.]